MKKSWIIILVVVAVVAWMGITLANNKKQINESKKVVDRSNISIPVATIVAAVSPMDAQLSLPATLLPNSEADITVTAQGKLSSLKIDLGTKVTKGEIVGSVDTKLKELSLKTTELSIDKLSKDYQRYKELYEGKAATEVNYTDARYQYENAKLQAAQIKQQIADSRITAPITGTVVKKNIEAGEFVSPGNIIATVVDISRLKASVMMNEKDVYNIKTGQKTTIRTDIFPDKIYNGTVSFISPRGDDNHNYLVEVLVENNAAQPLKAGTFIRLDFGKTTNASALQIPKNALVEGMKNPYIYVVKNGLAEVRKLVLGRELGENVEIVSGLQEGEQVVTSGQINLSAGSKVEVINNK
ncbi:MAG: efflux RND transporter periplasmic adaptor subunit [Sphingobacteriales bacterium]|nr:MAG: efflux RND transporter periplasmic adaptor subunit [Sphingobacteriales bacterium]